MLAEDGGEPRLRIWLYDKGQGAGRQRRQGQRHRFAFDRRKQALNFAPDKDSLLSRETVPEPHAFEINIGSNGQCAFTFSFSQEEGKVELSDAQIKAASIGIDTAGLQASSLPCNCRARSA